MNPMDNIGDEYQNYSETRIYLQKEEFINSNYAMDEALSGSNSSDGAASSADSKNMVSEKNPRKMLNDSLLALRSVVPKSSKMDEASIIKNAIDYVQELHEQQTRIEAEIVDLETGDLVKKKKKKNLNDDNNNNNSGVLKYEQEELLPAVSRHKKKTIEQVHDLVGSRITPIEVHELSVAYMGQKTVLVSLTCNQKTDTMVRLCQVFESLKLNVITINITAVSGRLLKTVFVEANEDEKEDLRMKIETAIAALNDPRSPMSL